MRNPIAKAVTRIRPKVVESKRAMDTDCHECGGYGIIHTDDHGLEYVCNKCNGTGTK